MSAPAGADPPRFELDHLVVGASSLAVGRRWCEATFGAEASTGGVHATMGTHNVLLSLVSPTHPRAYLEIIAVDPDAPAPPRKRWFDLDAAGVRERVAASPTLLHWVARSDDIDAAVAWLRAAGHEPGTVTASERVTPRGMLRWRISLPVDGRRPAGGAVPLVISWPGEHPTDSLPASGVTVESIRLSGVSAALARGLIADQAGSDASPLQAGLVGPRGPVSLSAPPASL